MPGTATRYLDLVFKINTSQFDRSYNNVIQKINNIKVALSSLNNASGSGSLGLNQTVRGFNNASKAAHSYGRSLVQTKNSMRIFGSETGVLKTIAIIRSEFLLAAFAIGRFVTVLKSAVEEARDTQMALAGVQSIAKGMGHDVDKVNSIVKKYADTGLLTMRESANAVKMLSSMEGVTIDLVDKAMQAMLDFAAFNRLGQYTIGEAVMVAAQGFKEQRAQVTDAIGWVKNLQDAWKEYGKEINVSMGKQSPAQKNLGSLNILIKDSAVVQGNAQRALELYGGSVSKLNTAITILKREIGETLIPLMADWARKFYSLVDSALKYYKVNRDIIALNMKEGFGVIVDTLIDVIKFLGQATAKIVEFVAKNKEIIAAVLAVTAFNKAISITVTLFGTLSGVLKTLSVWVGMFKAASNFKEVIILLNTAVTVFLGPFGWLLIAVGAVAAAFLLLSKNSDSYYKKLKEQRAEDTQKLRAYNEQIEATAKLRTSERDLVRAKILSGDTSAGLKIKEDQLTQSLVILEGQAKKTGEEIRKSLLLQNIPSILDIGERAQKTSKVSLSTDPIASFFSRITGINAVEAAPRMKKLVDSLNPYRILVEQITKTNDEAKLREYQVKVLQDLSNISSFATGKNITGQEKKDINELTRAYSELLTEINNKLPQATVKTTDTVEEQSDAMKRWLEALRNYQQKTAEIAAPEGYATVTQKAKNEIEDLIKLAKDAGAKITPEIQKIFDVGLNTRQLEYNTQQIKKFFEAQSKVAAEHAKQQKEWKDKAQKEELELRSDFFKKLEDLERDYASSRMTNYEKEIFELDKLLNEFELLVITLPSVASNLKVVEDIIKRMKEQVERTKLLDYAKQWQDIFSPLSQAAEDVFVNIRQEEKDTIESLRKELEKGTIDQQEYLARVDLAHRNAAINIQNAWNSAGKNIAMSMFNYLQQVVTTAISSGVAVKAALSTAFNPASLAIGLGLAVLGAGVSALSANTFKEKSTLSYEDISPNVSDTKRRTYGSISAASPMYINVTPTVNIEGQTVLIGSGSITEFEAEASEMIKNTIQMGLNNNEFNLAGLSPA